MRRILSLAALSVAIALFAASTTLIAADAPAKGSVSGKVVDATGAVVKGAKVGIVSPDDIAKPKAQQATGGGRTNPMDKSVVPAVTTGDDGTYKLADVPAGKYVVLAQARAAGRGQVNVEVTAGQETKADDIKLKARTPKAPAN